MTSGTGPARAAAPGDPDGWPPSVPITRPIPSDLAGIGVPTPTSDGPAFAEPWQASIFAMTVHLAERGRLAWPRFAQALGARLREEPDYYRAWSGSLLDLLAADGIVSPTQLEEMEQRWHDAAAATPHGQPISL